MVHDATAEFEPEFSNGPTDTAEPTPGTGESAQHAFDGRPPPREEHVIEAHVMEPAAHEPPPPAPVAAPEPAPAEMTPSPRRRSTVRERAPVTVSGDSEPATPAPVALPPAAELPQPVVVESPEAAGGEQPRRSGWWRKR
jgi:ribonuclease E